MESRINDLVAANDKLSVRAAVSYTELTPRFEKFNDFFKEYDLEFFSKNR